MHKFEANPSLLHDSNWEVFEGAATQT